MGEDVAYIGITGLDYLPNEKPPIYVVDGEADWVVFKGDGKKMPKLLYNLTMNEGDILLCLRTRVEVEGKKINRFPVIAKLSRNNARMIAIELAMTATGPEV